MKEQLRHECVLLDASLTVPHAITLASRILDAIDAADVITIDISNATEMDVSFLQTLVAARKTALIDRKTLRLRSKDATLLAREAARCGLSLAPSADGIQALPSLMMGANP